MCVYVGECFQSTALISDSVSEAKVAPEQLQKDYRDNQVQRRSAAHTANQFYQVVLFPPQTANFYYFFFYPVPVLIIFVQGIWCDSFRCVIGGVPDALRTRTQAYSGVPYFGIQMLYKYKHTIRILFGKLLSFQTFMNGLTIQDFDFLIASARKMQTHCLSLTFSCIHAYS